MARAENHLWKIEQVIESTSEEVNIFIHNLFQFTFYSLKKMFYSYLKIAEFVWKSSKPLEFTFLIN